MISATLLHEDPRLFPNPRSFDPDRFAGRRPDPFAWVPFGGGRRRCPGAAFAHMELDVVLRTMLHRLELEATTAPDEPWLFRGVAFAPGDGGRAVVRRRQLAVRPDEAAHYEPVACVMAVATDSRGAIERMRKLLGDGYEDARMRDGYLDLLGAGGLPPRTLSQRAMTNRVLPFIYERLWRPIGAQLALGSIRRSRIG